MSKRKNYYSNKNNKYRKYNIEVGLCGFLCSCNNREKDCIREAYNILNKYADKFEEKKSEAPPDSHNLDEDDLSKELEQLKSENASLNMKKFQVIDSGAKNFLFIRTTLEDPILLANAIAKDILENGQQQTKFLLRLIPIETTCKAYMDDIKAAIMPLLVKHFSGSIKTYSIAFNHRNNNSLKRDDVIKVVAELVGELPDKHVVNLSEPEITIVVEAIKGFAYIGVIPDYIKYKKFNLHSICGNEGSDNAEVVKDQPVDKELIVNETSEVEKEVTENKNDDNKPDSTNNE